MMKFNNLRLGMEVWFIDWGHNIVHTKISGFGNNSFSLAGCGQEKDADDSRNLFKTKHDAISKTVSEYKHEIRRLEEQIAVVIRNEHQIIDLRKKS